MSDATNFDDAHRQRSALEVGLILQHVRDMDGLPGLDGAHHGDDSSGTVQRLPLRHCST